MSKFYNLPGAWNPGLAIPKSVLEEGLQRHAYVTRWAPRGTYDSATGGNPAGYAIPRYVMNEGTGRGTFTTAWTPRGYYGARLPHYMNRQPVPNIVLGDVMMAHSIPSTTAQVVDDKPTLADKFRGLLIGELPKRHYTDDENGGKGRKGRPDQRDVPIDPNSMVAPPSPMQAITSRILPLALLGGAAFVAYRFIKGSKP